MKQIACIEYNEQLKVLVVVFEDGEHECYLNVEKKEAWLILRNYNSYKYRQAS